MPIHSLHAPDYALITSYHQSAGSHARTLPCVVVLRGHAIDHPERFRQRTRAPEDLEWTSSSSSERGTVRFSIARSVVWVNGHEYPTRVDSGTCLLLVDVNAPAPAAQTLAIAGVPTPPPGHTTRMSLLQRFWRTLIDPGFWRPKPEPWVAQVLAEPAVQQFLYPHRTHSHAPA